MANTKEYKIVINGIQESIDAVKSLNTQLDSLESRIKSLEGKAVGIKTSGGGSKTSSTSSLSEEEKLERQIAQLDEKRVAYSQELYQNYLAAKDVLKETVNDQKQLAAAERIQADNYSNTMTGIKQKLADLKSVHFTTDISTDEFKNQTTEINALNEKLKQLEAEYGVYSRNVGNYANGVAEGLQKIGIEVNGSIKEFDNVRQALKALKTEMQTLSTKQDMGIISEEEVERLQGLIPVVKQLESSIADAGKPMDSLLDTMQGLIALGSSVEGFAALFGMDEGKIQQTIQKLVALQNILQGIEVIKKQMQTGEGIGGMFAKGNAAIDKFSASLLGVSTNANAAKKGLTQVAAAEATTAVAAKGATVAVKTLSFALKTVGIGVVLTAVAFLVEGLQSLIEWFTKADEATERAKKINEEAAKAYGEAKSKIVSYTDRVKDFNGTKQQEKKLVDELNSQLGKELGTYKTLAEWQKVLIEKGDAYCESMLRQAKAQAALNLVTEAYVNLQKVQASIESGEYHHWYQTVAGDREADARALQEANQKIENAEKEYRKIVNESIKFDKEHSLGDFSPQIDTSKKTGAKLGKTIKDIEADLAKARVDAMKQGLTKTLAQLELERNKRIAEAKKTGKLVNEQIEQINKTYQQKIFDARVQYHANLINEEKKYADEVAKLNEEMYQKEVEISRKRNELKLENDIGNIISKKAVDSATTSDGDILDMDKLNEIYERSLRNLTYDYNFELPPKVLRQYKELEEELNNLYILIEGIDTSTEEGAKKFEEYETKIFDIGNQLRDLGEKYPNIVSEAEKIIGSTLDDSIQTRMAAVEGYYEKVLNFVTEAAEEEINIEKGRLKKELEIERDAEKERHKIAVSSIYDKETDKSNIGGRPRYLLEGYKTVKNNGILGNMSKQEAAKYFESSRKAMDEWLNSLDEKVEKGKISWEEYIQITGATALKGYQKAKTDYEEFLDMYNSLSDEEKSANEKRLQELVTILNETYVKYLEKVRAEQEAHDKQMKLLKEKCDADVEQADRDHQEKLRQATVDYHSQMISEYERAMSAISNKLDKAEKTTPLGIINYSATKKALKDLQESIATTLHKIEVDKMNLVSKLQEGKISFGDFSSLMDQLNTLGVQAQETSKSVSKSLQDLFSNTMQSINQIVGQLGSALSSLVGALGDYTDTMYENRIKDLEKYIEEYEKKLDEQKEITQKYADDVNSIEEELSSSRGDRRQQLIDQLNAQLAAQRGSLAQEKRMEKEKQRMEQEKEELEKEKFEQQKKVQRAQATMSGALAVTNALAVQPIWVGIATAAMVAAMTAVQIATINAQKYANGGVIQGKSHSQGGVKVLGGQAEVEGGEFITNKVTTAKNVDLLEYINTKRRKVNLEDLIDFYGSPVRRNVQAVRTKFADGGIIPTLRTDFDMNDRLLTAFEDYSNRQVVVSVVDINDRQAAVDNVKVLAGLTD